MYYFIIIDYSLIMLIELLIKNLNETTLTKLLQGNAERHIFLLKLFTATRKICVLFTCTYIIIYTKIILKQM